MTNTTKTRRYTHVDVVKIPEEYLLEIREANRIYCSVDDLMPRYSDEIEYITLSKTHFVHAHKLAQEGNRGLWNDKKVPIKWLDKDEEGLLILEQGPICQIFEEGLFEDKDALIALASEDNMNAGIQLGEDEMQAFGRTHQLITKLGDQKFTDASVLEKIRVGGMGTFSDSEWLHMIKLRAGLPTPVADVLQTCHFQASAGRVRVKAADFGQAARLDPRTPWSKVALMLLQYIGNLPAQSEAVAATFTGRRDKFAKKLPVDHVHELVAELDFVKTVEVFIMQLLGHYSKPTCKGQHGLPDKDLLSVRGQFLRQTGNLLMKVGQVLDNANRREKAQGRLLSPARRKEARDEESKGHFSKLEHWFRKEMVRLNLFAEADLPAVLHPVKTPADSGQVAPSQGTLLAVKAELSSGGPQPAEAKSSSDTNGEAGLLTLQHVYERLGVKGCGENVLVSMENVSLVEPSVKCEADSASKDDTVGVMDVHPHSKQGKDMSSWRTVRLLSVSLPNAVVEVRPGDSESAETVHVDFLWALGEVKAQKKITVHPILLQGGTTLPAYDYKSSERDIARSVAEHMLTLAHVAAMSSVEGLTVSRLSEDDKTPVILQVRAKQNFKKGTLFLPPACGHIFSKDDSVASTKVVHSSMLSKVALCVICATRKNGTKAVEAPQRTTMSVFSPLQCAKSAKARAEVLDNLSPFWAVLRCDSPQAKSNMELLTPVLMDQAFDSKSPEMLFHKFPKLLQYSVSLPVLRNSGDISTGDVLCLPMFDANHE